MHQLTSVAIAASLAITTVPYVATAAPITLVRDIVPGAFGSDPGRFTAFGDKIYFRGGSPSQFYVSDGTEAGTAPTDWGVTPEFATSHYVAVSGGKLFFSDNHADLYVTDGTAAGTLLLKAATGLDYPQPMCLTDMNGMLYFASGLPDESKALWRSDGTPGGTVPIKAVDPSSGGSVTDCIRKVGNRIFFVGHGSAEVGGSGLWTSDGTTEGTVRISDNTIGIDSAATGFGELPQDRWIWAASDDTLYFEGNSPGGLWKSDGTPAGTTQVEAIGSQLFYMTVAGENVYFLASDAAHGDDLWGSDGTAEGTDSLDVGPGTDSFIFEGAAELNGYLYLLVADPVFGTGLWRSDGTPGGTIPIKIIEPTGNSLTARMYVANNRLYFSADDGVHGAELWRSDGTPDGTYMVEDLNPGAADGFYDLDFGTLGSTLFFPGRASGLYDWELYSLDITECGNAYVDPGEDCDDGNTTDGDCCSATCAFESNGSACADDGSICSSDLCDGAGACVHAPTNAGVECRTTGRESDTGLRIAEEGQLGFPIGIDEHWFQTNPCGDGTSIQLFPITGTSCSGWHTFDQAPASTAKLKSIVENLQAGTYLSPEATAAQANFEFTGGTIDAAIPAIRDLYDLRKEPDGSWTFLAPVYEDSACANANGARLIVGFATVTIYSFTSLPNAIHARVGCELLPTGEAGAGDFGTHVIIDQECDVAETCDGTSPVCPADAKQPAGTACDEEYYPFYPCTADVCDGAGICTHPAATAGTVCRGSEGVCDPAEVCDGSLLVCPADQKSTSVCREAAGVCDLAETCDGFANACPADVRSTATCRDSAGVCDPGAETCDGTSNDCPVDVLSPLGTTCRVSSGVCDPEEACTGTSAVCPADVFSDTTVLCRASGGACDSGEMCTGLSGTCPADVVAAPATPCREASGVCDVSESCDGISAVCPPDAFVSAATVCRGAAGVCDESESCTGMGAACPEDGFVSAATTCRSSAGACDFAETCTGGTAACPADSISPPGTPCGSSSVSSCSAADSCDASGLCVSNDLPPGEPCDDGDICTSGDSCLAGGTCSPGDMPLCDDGNPCTVDSCAPGTGDCSFDVRPATGCRVGGKSGLGLSTRGDGKARWKWGRGEETACEDFGAPDVDTAYDVCIYDGIGGGEHALASHFALPASGNWELGKSCRWSYEDRAGTSDGITSLRLTPHEEGRASIQFGAAGQTSPIPVPVSPSQFMSMNPNVTVQIHNSLGICWESEFTTARKNSGEKFKTTRLILVGGIGAP